jgi:hypothetical protein
MDAEAPQEIIDFNRPGATLVQLDDGRVFLVGNQDGYKNTSIYHPLIKTSPAASKPVSTPTATAVPPTATASPATATPTATRTPTSVPAETATNPRQRLSQHQPLSSHPCY